MCFHKHNPLFAPAMLVVKNITLSQTGIRSGPTRRFRIFQPGTRYVPILMDYPTLQPPSNIGYKKHPPSVYLNP